MRKILIVGLLLSLPMLAMGQQHRHTGGNMPMAPGDTTKKMMQGGMMQQGGMMGGGMGMMKGGMMGGGMGMMQQMGMMMQNPMHRAMVVVFTLPYLEEELGLTEEQKEQLKALKQEFLQQRKETMQAMMGLRKTIMEKMQDPNAPLDDIRASMQTMMNMKLNMHMQMLETARKMKQVLTEEQREKLRSFTPQQWMHAMMRHMPMMEMMQMHHGMMGMMGGGMGMGMMQGGMQGMQGQMPMQQHKH